MGIETVALMAIAGGTALKMAGDIAGGVQAKKAGEAQQAAYEAKAKADLFNAAVANNRAASERDAAAAAAQDYTREGSRKLGAALALQGASGVTPEGSPLMVNSAMIREIALGKERTIFTGEKRARALQDEESLLQASSAFSRQAGQVARQTGVTARDLSYLQAGGSLLSGVASYGTTSAKFGAR
jgi:hypothetical protein